MSEKDLYKKIILYSLVLTILSLIISWLIFSDIKIVEGIVFGALGRLIGFFAIIQGTSKVLSTGKPYLSIVNYVGRLIFYGIVIFLALKFDVNVFALLLGFTIINVVIYIMELKVKKGV